MTANLVSSDSAYPIVAKALGLPFEGVTKATLIFEHKKDVDITLKMYSGEKFSSSASIEIRRFKLIEINELGEHL